jgi:rhodanese-related sulfurtransferase
VKFFLDNIILIFAAFVSGLMLLWPLVQRKSAGAAITAHGATRMMNDQNAQVVDIRERAEFDQGHLPNSRCIPAEELSNRGAELNAKHPVIVVCARGARAGKAAAALRSGGRSDVFVLESGIAGWREAGLPLVKS